MRTTSILGAAGLVAFAGFLPSSVQAQAEPRQFIGASYWTDQSCAFESVLRRSPFFKAAFCAAQGTVVSLPLRLVSGLIVATASDWNGLSSSFIRNAAEATESLKAFVSPLIPATDALVASIRCGASLPSCSSSLGLQLLESRFLSQRSNSRLDVAVSESTSPSSLPKRKHASAAAEPLQGSDPNLKTPAAAEPNTSHLPSGSGIPAAIPSIAPSFDSPIGSQLLREESQLEVLPDEKVTTRTLPASSAQKKTKFAEQERLEQERIAAEQQRLEQERIAAEQQRLEEERRIAAELKRQEEEVERARIAAEQERLEQERIAAEQQRLEEERRIAAELKRQEEEAERARIAAEQERLEQERIAAEQQRLEEEQRIAAELKRQEDEAERARIADERTAKAVPVVSSGASTELERLAAERRALELERTTLEKEKLAFERKQLEQERRALAAERRKIAKQRRNLQSGAGNDQSQIDEISAVASVIQDLETDDMQAEEQARLQAERQRLERERQRRIAAERRRLARQRRLEQEKQRLAIEQERLEQQRRQLAAEQSQLDQELVASQSIGTSVVPENIAAKVDSLRNPPLMLAGVPTVRAAFIDSEGNTPYLKQNPFQQRPVGTGDPLSDDVKRIMRVKQDLRRLDIALSTVKPQPTTYLARGNVKYSLGDFKGASRDYQRAIDADPQLADAYVNRGAALRKAGRLSEAIASYNKVIAMRPGDASAYRNRGIAREAQGDVQGAVADWRTASRLGDTEVLQWIAAATQPPTMAKTVGSVLAQVAPAAPAPAKSNKVLLAEANGLLAKGSPAQARDLYIKILQNDAADRKALFNLAVAFRKAGQYKEALIAYDKYIAVVPNDPAAFRNRGIVKEMQRDLRGACTDWQQALQLGATDVKSWIDQQCR